MFVINVGKVLTFLYVLLVDSDQSTSTQPPSLVLMAGRVQNVPTLAPIHLPLHLEFFPNLWNFFPLVL